MSEYHQHTSAQKSLSWAVIINVGIVIVEAGFGIIIGSVALISEAVHNGSDIGSMLLSWWGEAVSKKPKTDRKTYGYKRAEIIIAFVNGGVLLGISCWILIESVVRIFHPEPVAGYVMLVVAGISLIGNGLATLILVKNIGKNLSLKSVWLHSLQDVLFSLGVVIAAAIISVTGWNWIDPIASILISIFLLREVYSILARSVNILLDSVPADVNFEDVRKSMLGCDGVKSVDDLHIWQTGSDDRFLSAHLVTEEMDGHDRIRILAKLRTVLEKEYSIHHQTIQMVSEREMQSVGLECDHCN